MTAAKALEYRIIRQMVQRREAYESEPDASRLAARLIAILAATCTVFTLGALLEELIWALLAAGTVVALAWEGGPA